MSRRAATGSTIVDESDLDPAEAEYDEGDYYDDQLEGYDGHARPGRGMGWLLLIGGLLSLVASWALTVERIELAQNPDYVPTCSLNPVISCGSVMTSDQAALFGFPNPLLGLMAFPVVMVTGLLVLARVGLPAWWWRWMQFGVTYGFLFVLWLMSQSLYSIHALCPYCMVVWAMAIPIFWKVTGWNLANGIFGDGIAQSGVARFLDRYHWVMTLLTFAVIITLIGIEFWYYWRTLF